MHSELNLTRTLSAVELDAGDTLDVRLLDGSSRKIELRNASAHVSRRGPLPYKDGEGVVEYRIRADLTIDGQLVQMVRTIPSQENFRDPPCVFGLRIWLDATGGIDEFLTPHGTTGCYPAKQCRLAIWDASARICPPLVHPWCPLPQPTLRLSECYSGEDTWMGPYSGTECHGGLDINHPAGTPLWTPIAIHEHELFDRLDQGANNNRWRGLHHWADGKTWVLQSHHIVRLLVPEGESVDAGVHYAEAAGVLNGAHEHSHFVFGVRDGRDRPTVRIDPWLLFWQMYRDRRATARD